MKILTIETTVPAVKRSKAEITILRLLDSREVDGDSTAEIARKVVCSPATALRILNKLEAEGYQRPSGGTLGHIEGDAGRKPGSRNFNAPAIYYWVCQ